MNDDQTPEPKPGQVAIDPVAALSEKIADLQHSENRRLLLANELHKLRAENKALKEFIQSHPDAEVAEAKPVEKKAKP